MYLKLVANKMYLSYRILLRTYRPLHISLRANIVNKEVKNFSTHAGIKPLDLKGAQSRFEYARRLLINNVLKRVTSSLAADLRRKSARKLFNGNPSPFFALIGISLASGTGVLTKEYELEGICYEIREAIRNMRKNIGEEESVPQSEMSLDSLEFGSVIAKGSNAVVYEAREKTNTLGLNQTNDSFPLAVKMMFNFDAESNSIAILRSMYREMVPLRSTMEHTKHFQWENGILERMRKLAPHPNIVKMYTCFTDFIPELSEARTLYPDALPSRLNPSGCGRNMSLFLVMKKYNTSLKQYLIDKKLNIREAIILFTQLLEAVVHLNKNEIAHRDLKSDNILLDTMEEEEDTYPKLVVTDFGCCLSNVHYGLVLPYKSPETDKGGNAALMAPEVALAEAGLFSTINYSKSDLWTAGTIAFELFSGQNPFYAVKNEEGRYEYKIRNTTYTEEMLPPLSESVPSVIKRLIYNLLVRSPSKRMDSELAATICQLYLWAPSRWINSEKLPSTSEVLQWLLSLTTKILYKENSADYSCHRSQTEYQLISTFLHRVKFSVVYSALYWIHDY